MIRILGGSLCYGARNHPLSVPHPPLSDIPSLSFPIPFLCYWYYLPSRAPSATSGISAAGHGTRTAAGQKSWSGELEWGGLQAWLNQGRCDCKELFGGRDPLVLSSGDVDLKRAPGLGMRLTLAIPALRRLRQGPGRGPGDMVAKALAMPSLIACAPPTSKSRSKLNVVVHICHPSTSRARQEAEMAESPQSLWASSRESTAETRGTLAQGGG